MVTMAFRAVPPVSTRLLLAVSLIVADNMEQRVPKHELGRGVLSGPWN
jgi:hypothetical protein